MRYTSEGESFQGQNMTTVYIDESGHSGDMINSGTQHPAMGTLKNTIQNLTFVVGGKGRDVLGPVHKAQ